MKSRSAEIGKSERVSLLIDPMGITSLIKITLILRGLSYLKRVKHGGILIRLKVNVNEFHLKVAPRLSP